MVWSFHRSSSYGRDQHIDRSRFDDASPIPFTVPRFEEPLTSLSDIPVDVVLISHDHYDHLSYTSIQHFIDTDVQFVVPLGVSSYLVHWGIDSQRITELDWWEEHQIQNITISQLHHHNIFQKNGPQRLTFLWASYVVQGQKKMYISVEIQDTTPTSKT